MDSQCLDIISLTIAAIFSATNIILAGLNLNLLAKMNKQSLREKDEEKNEKTIMYIRSFFDKMYACTKEYIKIHAIICGTYRPESILNPDIIMSLFEDMKARMPPLTTTAEP